jgi:isoquinoline 1-oxidoreductase subunit alpha
LADNRLPLRTLDFCKTIESSRSVGNRKQSEASLAEVMGNRPNNPRSSSTDVTINCKTHQVEAEPDTPLLWVIRDELGMTGTKYGCGIAQCGACTVLIDGQPTRSCVTRLESVAGMSIATIEAINEDPIGRRVVEAWVAHQVPQCGYCQSGQVMTATALLKQSPKPSEQEIAAAMINLCRCGTYNAIATALRHAAEG